MCICFRIIFFIVLPWPCSAAGDIHIPDTGAVGATGVCRQLTEEDAIEGFLWRLLVQNITVLRDK